MGLFWRTDRELEARVDRLEDRIRTLTAEWERAQLDLVEVSRRASNVIRSLARREASQEAHHGPNGGGAALPTLPGLDPISQRILARRGKHGVQGSGTEP